MKYLISYKHDMKINDDMELIITYYHLGKIDKIIDFLKSIYPNRITIRINPADCNDFFNTDDCLALNKFYNEDEKANFTVEFPFPLDDEHLDMCNFPYFFQTSIDSYVKLQYYINLGVSDVIITEDLLYDLENVRKFTNQYNVKVRSYVNSFSFNSFKDYFILPGDVSHAESFFDILIMPSTIHYNVYRKGTFKGDLKAFLDCPVGEYNDEDPLLKLLFDVKSRCKLKCLKGKNCKYCSSIAEKHQLMIDANNNPT